MLHSRFHSPTSRRCGGLVGLLLVLSAGEAPARAGDRKLRVEVDALCKSLTSPREAVRSSAELELERHEKAYFDHVLEELQAPQNHRRRWAAVRTRILLSPWWRARQRALFHKDPFSVASRKKERATAHRSADRVRRAALGVVGDIVGQKEVSFVDLQALWEVGLVLAEVCDQPNRDRVAELLEADTRPDVVHETGRILCVMYGLPQFKKKKALLEWHERNRGLTGVRLATAIVTEWFPLTEKENVILHAAYPFWNVDQYEPLIRLGSSAIPALRARRRKVSLDTHEGLCLESVLAWTTGRADRTTITRLLAGGYAQHWTACDMIVATGGRGWKQALADSLADGLKAGRSAHALAVCYRKEAIPAIEAVIEEGALDERFYTRIVEGLRAL